MKITSRRLRQIIKEELSSLVEVNLDDVDPKAFKLLSYAFTADFNLQNLNRVKDIRFVPRKNAVLLADVTDEYYSSPGNVNMFTAANESDLSRYGLTAALFVEWLLSHGARQIKMPKLPKYKDSIYD